MPRIRQPIPDHQRDLCLLDRSLRGSRANRLQHVHLILAGAGQERAYQGVLALEHEEQHTRG